MRLHINIRPIYNANFTPQGIAIIISCWSSSFENVTDIKIRLIEIQRYKVSSY